MIKETAGNVDTRGSVTLSLSRHRSEEFDFTADIAIDSIVSIDTETQDVTLDGVNAVKDFSGAFFAVVPGAQDIIYSDSEGSRTVDLSITREDRKA